MHFTYALIIDRQVPNFTYLCIRGMNALGQDRIFTMVGKDGLFDFMSTQDFLAGCYDEKLLNKNFDFLTF